MLEPNKTIKIKCDVHGCMNDADYTFPHKTRSGKFFICKNCLKQLYAESAVLFTPKSPQNTIKKMIDKRESEVTNG